VALAGQRVRVVSQDRTADYNEPWRQVVVVPGSEGFQEPMLVEYADEDDTGSRPSSILMLLRGPAMHWSMSRDRGDTWTTPEIMPFPTAGGVPHNIKLLARTNHLLLLYHKPATPGLFARVLTFDAVSRSFDTICEKIVPGSDAGGGLEFRYPSLFIDSAADLAFITYSVGYASYMTDLRMQVLPISWFYAPTIEPVPPTLTTAPAIEVGVSTLLSQRYQLYHSSDLEHWQPIGSPFIGAGDTKYLLYSIRELGSSGFFRAEVLP
jgi:hypothetical protein